LARICDVLAPYIGKTEGTNTNSVVVFKCPTDKLGLFAAEGSSYEWNADLNGHRIDKTRSANLFRVKVINGVLVENTNLVMRFPRNQRHYSSTMKSSNPARQSPARTLSSWMVTSRPSTPNPIETTRFFQMCGRSRQPAVWST